MSIYKKMNQSHLQETSYLYSSPPSFMCLFFNPHSTASGEGMAATSGAHFVSPMSKTIPKGV